MSSSRLLIQKKDSRIWTMLMQNDLLTEINVYKEGATLLGNIYVAKVKNVVKNIQAAFVEIENRQLCFLPMDEFLPLALLNRSYDGRLLEGDELLVQVKREAVKSKEPVVSCHLSFSGKYAVLALDGSGIHFSRKLPEQTKKDLSAYFKQAGLKENLFLSNSSGESVPVSAVIRTNAGNETDFLLIKEEVLKLQNAAQEVLNKGKYRSCFSCLLRQPEAYLTEIRDTYESQYDSILTDDPELFRQIQEFFGESYPEEVKKVQLYEDTRLSMSALYGLESKVKEALSEKVWLKSGGYLVIEPTEALTVIDVNTGKYSGKKSIQDTFRMINDEAAVEIARQLRLRNISGIIIIDFINMDRAEDRDGVMNRLKMELKKDSVPSAVVDMTPLGLVEVTRKKIRKTLKEQLA